MKYMKKFVYILLCITFVIGFIFMSACSSDIMENTDSIETSHPSLTSYPTPESTPDSGEVETPIASPTSDPAPEPTPIPQTWDWMTDYSSILQEYRLFVLYMEDAYFEDGTFHVNGVPVTGWFFSNIDYNNWGGGSTAARTHLGYALKDLNEDGIDELILLDSGYNVHAIFSTVNGEPKVLDTYRYRYECAILDSGLLHTLSSDGAGDWEHAILRLSPDGSELLYVVQYGSRSDIQDPGEQHYYRIENGEEEKITRAEFDAFSAQYPFYKLEGSDYTITPQITTENSGITYIPLFSE